MDFINGIKNGNTRITARFMSLIENQDSKVNQVLKEIYFLGGKAQVIGITGPPGSGKSSLISHLIQVYRKRNLTVGVIVVDPTSPFSGGALLGDRIRMNQFALDSKVFIRSMATKGQLGGIAPATLAFIKILDAYGCDIILVETVGAGQSEIDIVEIVDTSVVVLIPGMGDTIQTIKAGILEIADIFILNKSDLLGINTLKVNLEQMLALNSNHKETEWIPPIVETIANQSNPLGIDKMIYEIDRHQQFQKFSDNYTEKLKIRAQKDLEHILKIVFFNQIYHQIDPRYMKNIILSIANRTLDPYTAAQKILNEYRKTDK